VIRQYIWYGELPFQTYNDVDRTFYESIIYRTNVFYKNLITPLSQQTGTRIWGGLFTGRHNPIHGGLTVVVLTTDTREKTTPYPPRISC
jgi:hypothetical protein